MDPTVHPRKTVELHILLRQSNRDKCMAVTINLLKVRNVKSTICCSLNCTKYMASNGGGLASYIGESVEGAS
eukprot:9230181-Ditylum_brightwellii.AAC.1